MTVQSAYLNASILGWDPLPALLMSDTEASPKIAEEAAGRIDRFSVEANYSEVGQFIESLWS